MRAALVALLLLPIAGCLDSGPVSVHEAPPSGAWVIDAGVLPDNTTLRGHEITERFEYDLRLSNATGLTDGWGRSLAGFTTQVPMMVVKIDGSTIHFEREMVTMSLRASDARLFATTLDGSTYLRQESQEWLPGLYALAKHWNDAGRPTNEEIEIEDSIALLDIEVNFTRIETWQRYHGELPYPCPGVALAYASRFADPERLEDDLEEALGGTATVTEAEPDPTALPTSLRCFDAKPSAVWSWGYSGNRTSAHLRGAHVPHFGGDGSAIPERPEIQAPWTPVAGLSGHVAYVPGAADDPWVGWMHPLADAWHLTTSPSTAWFLGVSPDGRDAKVQASDGQAMRTVTMTQVMDDVYLREPQGGSTFPSFYNPTVPETLADPARLRALLAPWRLPEGPATLRPGIDFMIGEEPVSLWLGACGDRVARIDAQHGHLDYIGPAPCFDGPWQQPILDPLDPMLDIKAEVARLASPLGHERIAPG